MKFAAIATVASLAVAASAQIVISNPTKQTVWSSGLKGYLSWSGDCANMGSDAHYVKAFLGNRHSAGPFVADFFIDCSSPVNTSTYVNAPDIQSGTYYFYILTAPNNTYSPDFTVLIDHGNSGTSPGLIAGIAVAAVAVIGITSAFFVVRRRRKAKNSLSHVTSNDNQDGEKIEEISATPVVIQNQDRSQEPEQSGYPPWNNVALNVQQGQASPPPQYAFQFCSHPRPNFVTMAPSIREDSNHQQSAVVWEPKPFEPPNAPPSQSSALTPQSGNPRYLPGPQECPRPSNPQQT